jgi:hypothetical protein
MREPGQPLRIEHEPHLFGVFADVTRRRPIADSGLERVDVPHANEDVVYVVGVPPAEEFGRQIEAG